MRPPRANGQPAAIVSRHGDLLGVAVLGLRDGGIARISLFGDPAVVRRVRARPLSRPPCAPPAFRRPPAPHARDPVALRRMPSALFLPLFDPLADPVLV